MKVRSMVFTAAILSLGALPLLAQEPPSDDNRGPGRGPGRGPDANLTADKLKADLKLSDDQLAKMQPLLEKLKAAFEDMRKEMEAERAKGNDGPPDFKKMGEKMKAMQEKITAIFAPAKEFLSAEQFNTLTKLLNKRPQPPKGGPGDNGPGGDEGGM